MASNQAFPHQHLDLTSSTQTVEQPSTNHSAGEDAQYTYPPETETPDQRPIYQSEVNGAPSELPFADTASASTTVYSPVKQHQLITGQPSRHPNPIALQHAQLPLTALITSQQRPAAEPHYIQNSDYSTAKLPTAHDQERQNVIHHTILIGVSVFT